MEGKDNYGQAPVFSKVVRAGKRTYFFDVKQTKGKENYLTVTESKKRFKDNGEFYYEKHKLFLYKEDFDKFSDGLAEALRKIAELNSSTPSSEPVDDVASSPDEPVGDVPSSSDEPGNDAASYSDNIDNITRGTDDATEEVKDATEEVKSKPVTEEENSQK